jgi:hypothetical protein
MNFMQESVRNNFCIGGTIEEGKVRHDSGDYDPLDSYMSDEESPSPGLKKDNELTIIKVVTSPGELESTPKEDETHFSFDKSQM